MNTPRRFKTCMYDWIIASRIFPYIHCRLIPISNQFGRWIE